MTELRLEALTKRFGPARAPVRALDGITLAVAAGEFLTVVGPSGSGKTTLLRAIAGLETVDSGRIWFGERDVTTLATRRRNVGLVFAHGALYAHRTVAQNLAYGPHVHGMRGAALALRTREVARALHVEDLLDRRPPQLSSGQAQRVALGRALANAPDVLLLDEPLARLDVPLRSEIRDELRRAHRRFETTTLCVTHDQSEAMALGDRLAVIAAGKVLQVGTPREVYAAPASLFVASFFGAPPPATLRGAIAARTFVGRTGTPRLALDFECSDCAEAVLIIRAEAASVVAMTPAGSPDLRGVVRTVEDGGADVFAYVDWSDGMVVARVPPPGPIQGETVGLRIDRSRILAFDARSGIPISAGAHV